jgi:hypothetical protein
MKLAQALKLKNKLAGEVARLKELLTKQNVRSVKQAFDYNNIEVLANLRVKIAELVAVKAVIGAANAEIYGQIFRLAELKGLVTALNGLDSRHGIFVEHGNYGGDPVEVEYVAQIRKAEVDKLVAGFQEEIQSLQESLDEFNYTHAVNPEP